MLDPPPRLVIAFLLALAHQMIIYNHQMVDCPPPNSTWFLFASSYISVSGGRRKNLCYVAGFETDRYLEGQVDMWVQVSD